MTVCLSAFLQPVQILLLTLPSRQGRLQVYVDCVAMVCCRSDVLALRFAVEIFDFLQSLRHRVRILVALSLRCGNVFGSALLNIAVQGPSALQQLLVFRAQVLHFRLQLRRIGSNLPEASFWRHGVRSSL
jgi:hypothetical protein